MKPSNNKTPHTNTHVAAFSPLKRPLNLLPMLKIDYAHGPFGHKRISILSHKANTRPITALAASAPNNENEKKKC